MGRETRVHILTVLLILLLITSCDDEPKPNKDLKKSTTKPIETKKNNDNPTTPASTDSVETVTETPNRQFEWEAINYDSTKQYIYLTFDDGPQNGTVECMELCKKLNVKATFFMVGEHVKSAHLREIVRTIKYNYPEILLANHSTTHANNHYRYFYHHAEMAAEDFFMAQQTLEVPYKIIRLPGNSAWVGDTTMKASGLVRHVCNLLDSAGYNVVGWDVEWSFNHKTAYPVQTPQRIANQVDSALERGHVHTKNHVVILSHDRMFRLPNYTDSLAKFIAILKQNPKFVFETVDHYPGMRF